MVNTLLLLLLKSFIQYEKEVYSLAAITIPPPPPLRIKMSIITQNYLNNLKRVKTVKSVTAMITNGSTDLV